MQYEFLSNALFSTHRRSLAFLLLLTLLSWSLGLPSFIGRANAASLTYVSDTLSSSAPSVVSNHTIVAVTPTGVNAGETIKITFPAGFSYTLLDFGDLDFQINGTDQTLAASPSGGTWGVSTTTSTVTLTSGTGTVAAGATTTIKIGTNATFGTTGVHQITNPTAGSYEISVNATTDSANTRVMILSKVTVTAVVNTSFTFTLAGVNAGLGVNGTTTTATSTATTMPFATTTVGVPNTIAQDLSVTTNARNGFVVTVNADQRLTSATGADIDTFIDGANTATPVAWVSPTGTLAFGENGWGHEGVTSQDSDLNSDEFGSNLWAGNFVGTARQVFSHNGPADGTTADKGLTRVGYQIQISALQEAGTDYTQTLTYVATPTF